MKLKHSYALTLLLIPAVVLLVSCNRQKDSKSPELLIIKEPIDSAIRKVLDAQVQAWNRADLVGFMDGYADSPETTFISGDTVTRGYQTVLDRYKKNYDSREKMGTLAFSELEVIPLSEDAALVNGRFQLTRANDTPHGRFTLIFRRTKDGWRIVHDHTS